MCQRMNWCSMSHTSVFHAEINIAPLVYMYDIMYAVMPFIKTEMRQGSYTIHKLRNLTTVAQFINGPLVGRFTICATIYKLLRKLLIHKLRSAIYKLRKFTICAQHYHLEVLLSSTLS